MSAKSTFYRRGGAAAAATAALPATTSVLKGNGAGGAAAAGPSDVTAAIAGQPIAPSSVTLAVSATTYSQPLKVVNGGVTQMYVRDDGVLQAGSLSLLSGGGGVFSQGMKVNKNLVFGFTATTDGVNDPFDAALSRTATATIAVGNGTPGDASGTVQCAYIANGANIATATLSTINYIVVGPSGALISPVSSDTIALKNNAQSAPGNLSLGNLTASGPITAPVFKSVDTYSTLQMESGQFSFRIFGDSKIAYVGGQLSIAGPLFASGPIKPGSYTVATLPSASSYSGSIVTVSNPASGKRGDVLSNGTNWLYSDNSIAA